MQDEPRHIATDTIRVCLCDDVREFRTLMRFGLAGDPHIDVVCEAADGQNASTLPSQLAPTSFFSIYRCLAATGSR